MPFHQRRRRFDGLGDDAAEIDDRPVELQLSHADARDVQQIVDERRQLHRLPEDGVPQPVEARLIGPLGLQQLDGGENRRQWGAQLVAEDGEEFVLPPIALAHGLLGPPPVGDVGEKRDGPGDAAVLAMKRPR
ncbi:hypothetical protein D3C83_07900 [compost metagenome]